MDKTLSENRMDNWSNFFVGLNGKKDKTKYTEFGDYVVLDDATLAGIYISNGLGSRIVDVIADDMTREWISLEGDAGNNEILNNELIRLDAEEKFNTALKWQRLFGGSLIIIGAMDGNPPDKPLREKKIKTIEYLKVIDRTQINLSRSIFDENPTSPTFGDILVYNVNVNFNNQIIPMNIHSSRCLVFHNDPAPSLISLDLNTRYWGLSSLQKIYEALRDLGAVSQSITNILFEFIIGKYKFQNLNEMLAEGHEKELVTRMEIMELSKSILNAVILSDTEEYTRDYANLAGIPEVMDRFMLILSGYTGIPVTRLFGRSPAGLNATGENDLINYYDVVEANQRNKLYPPLNRLMTLLANWKGFEIPGIKFNSLYQLDEVAKTGIEKTKAEAKEIRMRAYNEMLNAIGIDPEKIIELVEKTELPRE